MLVVNLKKILQEKNITLSEISKNTGISIKALSAFQNQKTEGVQYQTIYKIVKYLDIDISELISIDKHNLKIDILCFEILSIDLFTPTNIEDFEYSIICKFTPSGQKRYFQIPISFRLSIINYNDLKQIQFIVNEINFANLPEIVKESIQDKNIEKGLYEIISYLFVQELVKQNSLNKFSYNWDILFNWNRYCKKIFENDKPLDELRYSPKSDGIDHNNYIFYINLIPLNPKIKYEDAKNSSTILIPDIDSFIKYKFVSHIEIDSSNFRNIYLKFI